MARSAHRDTVAAQSPSERLLSATEKLVLQEGAARLSTRLIGTEAGMNSALISYHFSGLPDLLETLLRSNVEIIHEARLELLHEAEKSKTSAERLDALITAYVDPIWLSPAKWNPAPARAVVRELLPAVDATARSKVVARINESVGLIATPLASLIPKLSPAELLMRLRLLSGATEMLQPRLDDLGLYPIGKDLSKAHKQRLRAEMLRFAKGALLAP